MKRAAPASLVAVAVLSTACQSLPEPPPAPPPLTVSLAAAYQQPAERALIEGIRLYEEASFDRAEKALNQALRGRLADARDQAAACKYLAFIACAFNRIADCEAAFTSAFAADPKFALSDAEIGHPVWGPVYRQIAAARPKP